MGKAYFVTNYVMHDPAGLPPEYGKRIAPMIAGAHTAEANFGAAFETSAGVVLEGSPDGRVVVIEFESRDALERWYSSPEYQEILSLRTDNSDGWAVIVEE